MVSSSSTAASAWNRSTAAPDGLVSTNVAWQRARSSLSSPASMSACSHQCATVASPLSQDAIDAASSSASTRAGPGGVPSTAGASSSLAAAGAPSVARRGGHDSDCGLRERSGQQQRLARLRCQRTEPLSDQDPEVGRHWERIGCREPGTPAKQRPGHLQAHHRVAAGGPVPQVRRYRNALL
jgi:hypothetical protein